MRQIQISVWFLATLYCVFLLSLTSCRGGPREARTTLDRLEIEWSAAVFLSRAARGDTQAVTLFLAAGMSPDTVDEHGRTALMWAAQNGWFATVQALLEGGAEVNKANQGGMSALIGAARKGHKRVVQLLLDHGADVNQAEAQQGETALTRAAQQGHTGVVQVLLENGADVNAATISGWTALMGAARVGLTQIAWLLIKNGADVSAQNRYGRTALMIAEAYHQRAIIPLLKEESGRAPADFSKSRFPLHVGSAGRVQR